MGRGTMFHVTKQPGCACQMRESDFYDYLDSLGASYVADESEDTAAWNVERFAERFKSAGFTVERCEPFINLSRDEPVDGGYVIRTGCLVELERCKINFFQSAFDALKKKVAEMSIEDFANKTGPAYDIRMLAENTYEDAVYYGEYGESIYSVDDFVRCMDADATYYIMPETVFMH